MNRRKWLLVLSGAACAVALVAVLLLIRPASGPDASGAAGSPSAHGGTSSATPNASGETPRASAAPDKTTSPTAGPSDDPSRSPSQAKEPLGPAPTPDSEKPLEVLPPSPSTAPALPPSTPQPTLLSGAAPDSANATGTLAAGYPADSLPPEPQSTIISSSVSTEGTRVQLSLVASTGTDVAGVLDFYTTALARYGYFAENPLATTGESTKSYLGADGTVVVTAQQAPGGTAYSLFASIVAAG